MGSYEELKMLQRLPLEVKIKKSQQRIREWVNHFGLKNTYISFSGGKDSTVLLDIARRIYPDITAIFCNTGLEYPEIVSFVKRTENVDILRPDKNFKEIITKFGYPVISKEVSNIICEARKGMLTGKYTYRIQRIEGTLLDKQGKLSRYNCPQWKFLLNAPFRISDKCCQEMKKKPFKKIKKAGIVGTMAEESRLRKTNWIRFGCNAFEAKHPLSSPLSFWTNQDILTYLLTYNLPISDVYGDIVIDDNPEIDGQLNICDMLRDYRGCKLKTTGCNRTGCMFCLYGAHLEKGVGRLERMKITHPKQYDFVMRGGKFDSEGMWIPANGGLGFKFVIDWINKNGNLNIKY